MTTFNFTQFYHDCAVNNTIPNVMMKGLTINYQMPQITIYYLILWKRISYKVRYFIELTNKGSDFEFDVTMELYSKYK